MKILLVGGGNTTSQLNMLFTQNQHTILASFSTLTPGQLNLFDDYEAVIVIAPEASITTDVLTSVVEKGKLVAVVAGTSDGIGAWASATGLPSFPYPLSGLDQTNLLEYLSRYAAGGVDRGDMYRRNNLGSDMTARIQSGMLNIRKIAVSGPKGGTGKTTVAVNLAIAFALSGFSTYLVDADGNVGAFSYHLRLSDVKIKQTLLQLIRDVHSSKGTTPGGTPFEHLANSGRFLQAFTDMKLLPTLKIIPGLMTENLGAGELQDEAAIEATIKGLYEAGAAANGVVIMDVGLNPSHPIHRAALANADAIAIVIRPEVPDIAFTQHWIKLMITSLAYKTSTKIATEFIAGRVKLCYNMVFDDGLFRTVHKLLNNTLSSDDKLGFTVVPNGVLPLVNQHLAFNASSSDRVTDIFAWRYKTEHTEDLAHFTDAMVSFGTQFLPVLRGAAAQVGLVPNGQAKKKSPLSLFGRG
jgi:MinD-like ATPase involved in chromosome partitioning or flagellar assembly